MILQLLSNKFPNPWNKYFSEKFEEFAKHPNIFRSIVAIQTLINTEMTQLCL